MGHELKAFLPGESLQGFPTAEIFTIGVDIWIAVESRKPEALLPEDLQGIDGAGGTTDMEQYFHNSFVDAVVKGLNYPACTLLPAVIIWGEFSKKALSRLSKRASF
jgi:hypothetical protein